MLISHRPYLNEMKKRLQYSCWLRMGDAVNFCLKTNNNKKMNKMIINNEYYI